jgi:hypothetical protein
MENDAMDSESFEPHNELERKLVAAWQGEISSEDFVRELMASEVFLPVADEETVAGIQRSTRAKPLTLFDEEGTPVLPLFTNPERAKPFLKDHPGYSGGLLAEFTWVLAKMGSGCGITLNPGWEVGFDMEPETVSQLG